MQVLDNVQQPIVITKIKTSEKKHCTQIISLASPVPKATMILCASYTRAKIYLTYKLVCCNIQWFSCWESHSTTAFFIICQRFFFFVVVYIVISIPHRCLPVSASPSLCSNGALTTEKESNWANIWMWRNKNPMSSKSNCINNVHFHCNSHSPYFIRGSYYFNLISLCGRTFPPLLSAPLVRCVHSVHSTFSLDVDFKSHF